MQAISRRRQRASEVAPVHGARHRPDQSTLHRLVPQHAATFIAHTECGTGAELTRFIKDEFDAFLECGILAHGFLGLRRVDRLHRAAGIDVTAPQCRMLGEHGLVDQTAVGGKVELNLKSPGRDGTTRAVMSPPEFMRRPSALVPRPRLQPVPSAKSSLSRPGRTASAGRGCSSESLTSTSSTAPAAAALRAVSAQHGNHLGQA